MILQRLRDAENEQMYGEFAAHEGDIVAGVVQRDARENARGNVVVRVGTEAKGSDGMIRPAEQVPGGSATSTATACAAMSSASAAACANPRSSCPVPTRIWCASSSRSRCPRSRTDRWRSSRWPGKPATAPRSPWRRRCPG